MAFNISERTIALPISTDVSESQYLFVKIDANGAIQPCPKDNYALGILCNAPSPGVTIGYSSQIQASVVVDGCTRLTVDAAYDAGTFLCPATTSDFTGCGASVANASSSNQYIRAYTLQPSKAAGDIVNVKLIDPCPGTGGAQGASGYSGTPGAVGTSGYSGVGTSGYSGIGTSGYSGIEGQSGYSGVP